MIKRIFEKHETLICMILIASYIIINSFCIQNFGVTDYRSAMINTVYSLLLLIITLALERSSYYGLVKVKNAKRFLYFIPLAIIVSVNLWNGVNINNTGDEIVFHVITMINVGFAEEMIFRGFLFKMMAKDNHKAAVIVSTLTFGIGHIINLFNRADIIPTLLQICYATAIGYLFVVIFIKSGSLIPCITAHAVNNSLSVFYVENTFSMYVVPMFLTVVPIAYAVYINIKIKDKENKN